MSTQQQQPVVLYPNTVTRQTPSSSHSNGSFGTVFIVLAVIVAISAVACCLGRICNKRLNKQKVNNKQGANGQMQHNTNFRPMERERGSDVEFGFEKARPADPRSGHRPFGNNIGHFSVHDTTSKGETNTSAADQLGDPKTGP